MEVQQPNCLESSDSSFALQVANVAAPQIQSTLSRNGDPTAIHHTAHRE